jgi:hypothetical protein
MMPTGKTTRLSATLSAITDCEVPSMKNEFKSYPEGYQKLMKKIVPWYFGPMREKMMRLLLTILTDG